MLGLQKTRERVWRKIRNILKRFVPYNSYYKPTSVYNSSKDYAIKAQDPAFQYIPVYPDCVSAVQVDKYLFDALSPHHIHDELAPDAERVFTTTYSYAVVVIPQGRLYTNNIDTIAYVTKDNELLDDMSYQWMDYTKHSLRKANNILEVKYFNKPVYYKGIVFSMVAGSSATWNYSHWLLDALPRLHLLKESGWFDKVNWFVVPAYKYDFHKDTLALLGIGKDQIIVANEYTHLTADTLITSSHPRGKRSYITPVWVNEFLRNSFLHASHFNTVYPPYIYISRRDASYRKVINEIELIDLLKEYGFVDYELATLPFAEKVKLFASARFVISISGAGLNNLVFCQPGTKVLEMFAEGFVHTVFYDIAKKVGLDYYPLIYKTNSTATSQTQGMLENIKVDLQEMRALLDGFLTSQKDSKPAGK